MMEHQLNFCIIEKAIFGVDTCCEMGFIEVSLQHL